MAVVIYVPAIRVIERHLRAQNGPETLEARAEQESKISVARRLILAADIAILATVGYWIGKAVGGGGAPPFR